MNNSKIVKTLEKIGFSPNEIKVYLTLNESGSTKAGKISKLANIDRSSAYNSLKSLQEKGLVSYVIIGQVKWYQVTGPKRIIEFIDDQKRDVEDILPNLQQMHDSKRIEGQVRLFKGLKGIRSVFMDMIREGKDNYVFGSEGQFTERLPDFAHKFGLLKKQKGMKTKMLMKKSTREVDVKEANHHYLPNVSESPAVTNIYGDKIAIIIWTDEPEAVVIENSAAAKAYKSYFDFMWKHSKKTK